MNQNIQLQNLVVGVEGYHFVYLKYVTIYVNRSWVTDVASASTCAENMSKSSYICRIRYIGYKSQYLRFSRSDASSDLVQTQPCCGGGQHTRRCSATSTIARMYLSLASVGRVPLRAQGAKADASMMFHMSTLTKQHMSTVSHTYLQVIYKCSDISSSMSIFTNIRIYVKFQNVSGP